LGNWGGVNRGCLPSFPQMNLRERTKEKETRQDDRDRVAEKKLKI